MIFSSCSAILSFLIACSQRMKHNYIKAVEYHYRVKKVFKMRIDCQKLRSYHKYTHKILTKTMCYVSGIDNTGNIQVFYIVSARNAIIEYIEVTNADIGLENRIQSMPSLSDDDMMNASQGKKGSLFVKIHQLDDNGGSLNDAFKQELNRKFNFKLSSSGNEKKTATGEVSAQIDHGIKNAIRITIIRDKTALSYDVGHITDVVKVTS